MSGTQRDSRRGRKIVLAASDSESSEYLRSAWRQMLLATLPARYAKALGTDWSSKNEVKPDGQATYVPNGLRVVEALLLEDYSPFDIAVCYTDQLEQFIGEDTRVVGLHAHNPLGITFATDVYAGLSGRDCEPINAAEFRRLILHPVLRKHKPHLKLIVGGPGAWQIEHKGLQDEWRIDCLVDGESEEMIRPLFRAAVNGEEIPRKVEGNSPKVENIPSIRHRCTLGVVEITRGCGRGCQFCSMSLRHGKSIPLQQIVANVRAQAAEGADSIMLTTEDLFLYEKGVRFEPNLPALRRLFESVASVEGVRYIGLTHGTMAPVVVNPFLLEELSPIAVGRSVHQHEASTHPDKRYAMMFVGLETGSVRLFKQYMKAKSYPFRPEQWPDVVLKGMEMMNRYNWFPMCTFIIGLPGEKPEDTRESLDLLFALRDAKWCVVPTLFVPLEDTSLDQKKGARIAELTDLQWEFFFTCWRYNMDFFRKGAWVQWRFNLGVPLYYYMLGRRLFGPPMKYPLMRFGHFPERWLRNHLYLDFSNGATPRYETPENVPVPDWTRAPELTAPSD